MFRLSRSLFQAIWNAADGTSWEQMPVLIFTCMHKSNTVNGWQNAIIMTSEVLHCVQNYPHAHSAVHFWQSCSLQCFPLLSSRRAAESDPMPAQWSTLKSIQTRSIVPYIQSVSVATCRMKLVVSLPSLVLFPQSVALPSVLLSVPEWHYKLGQWWSMDDITDCKLGHLTVYTTAIPFCCESGSVCFPSV
jgi:hypothetical protein